MIKKTITVRKTAVLSQYEVALNKAVERLAKTTVPEYAKYLQVGIDASKEFIEFLNTEDGWKRFTEDYQAMRLALDIIWC
jgi:hypothetical protein